MVTSTNCTKEFLLPFNGFPKYIINFDFSLVPLTV